MKKTIIKLKSDFNPKYEQLTAWRTAQGCTDRTYPAGKEAGERLDKLIAEREQELNNSRFHGVVVKLVGDLDFELRRIGLKKAKINLYGNGINWSKAWNCFNKLAKEGFVLSLINHK